MNKGIFKVGDKIIYYKDDFTTSTYIMFAGKFAPEIEEHLKQKTVLKITRIPEMMSSYLFAKPENSEQDIEFIYDARDIRHQL